MLERLHLRNVGPAREMAMDLAPRLNLITGDNGLGKSFLLDVAWWVLTRTWAREMAMPRRVSRKLGGKAGKPINFISYAKASIAYSYTKQTKGSFEYESFYDPADAHWKVKPSRPAIPGLVLYAQVDGGFSVWDPTQNYWTTDAPDRPSSFLFSSEEVWKGNAHCKGLISDWALWQNGNEEPFRILKEVLALLSPTPTEKLEPGELRRITVSDPNRYPTLRMPYGDEVPVIHASAGMRRVIALAYLLTWVWQQHVENAELRNKRPTREVVFLIDEIEGHLHPQWQRRIVPALLKVMDALTGKHGSTVQLMTATHSPLVLASVEPFFDTTKDAWFDLDLDAEDKTVSLEKRTFARQGEAGMWLTSEAFDMRSSRSVEAEQALEDASKLLSKSKVDPRAARALDAKLRRVLGETDSFWTRWRFVGETQGWLKPAVQQKRDSKRP